MKIREARPEDTPALAQLERLCPEMGRVSVRIDLRANHLGLAGRYPGAKGYVALAEDESTIIGTIFSSVGPTQLNGGLFPAAYLFSLRVHPNYRRRSVASTLISHARQLAREEEGARTTWAAVIQGNDVSLLTLQHTGFVRLRDLRAKIILGGLALPHGLPHLASRPVTLSDLPFLANASNVFHADHNFWRPKTSRELEVELEVPHHSLRDCEIALTENGTALAMASALEMSRLARLRLLGLSAFPKTANRLLSPLYGLFPLNALLLHHYFSPSDQPATGAALIRALHRRYLPGSWAAIVVADPLDLVSRSLDLLAGITVRVHLLAKSDETIDQSRPSYLR